MTYNQQLAKYHLSMIKMKSEAVDVMAQAQGVDDTGLKSLGFLGVNAIQSLMENGINSVDKLVSADESLLKKALNPVTLKQVKSYVKQNAGQKRDEAVAG
jgi:hypothetical protein